MTTAETKIDAPKPPEIVGNSEDEHSYDVKETTAWWVIKFIMWKMPKTKGGKKKLDKNGKEIGVIPSAVMRDEYEQFKKRFPEADFKEWTLQKFVDVVEEKIIEHLGQHNKNGSWQPNLKEAEQYVRDMCKLVIATITKTEPPPEVKERLEKTGTPAKDDSKAPTSPTPPPSNPSGGSGSPTSPDSGKTPETPDSGGEKPEEEPNTPEVVPPVIDPEKAPSPSAPQPEKAKDTRKPEEDRQKFKTKPEFNSPRLSVGEIFGNVWQAVKDAAYEALHALRRLAESVFNTLVRGLEWVIEMIMHILSDIGGLLLGGGDTRGHPKTRWFVTGGFMTAVTAILFWATGSWIIAAIFGLMTLSLAIYDYVNETD